MFLAPKPDTVMVRGEGDFLWDADGKAYLDFVQGWAVNCLGHCPQLLVHAMEAQARTLWNPSPAYHNAQARALAAELAQHSGLDRVLFANSGAEANEAAVKLARKWGQRHKRGAAQVITTTGSFHGRTLAMMCASGKPGFADKFPPRVPGFVHVPYGDADAVEAAIGDETVAVMCEPIQGEAGVVVPAEDYLPRLRALCDARGILWIADEVQTGIGRTGAAFAFEHAGVLPDVLTIGKGLGGGLPISAMACRSSLACFEPGDQGGTFNGNPLCAAVARAVVAEVCAPAFLAGVEAAAGRLRAAITDALGARLRLLRGRGLLIAAVLEAPIAKAIAEAAFERGLLLNAPQPDVLRFMPALNVREASIRELGERLSDAARAAPCCRP